jgi:hypothetical protein
LVFNAVGTGAAAVLALLVVVAEAELEAVVGVTEAAVAPAEGASWTPGAAELPQPATATASPTSADAMVIGLRMEVPEGSERI